MAQKRMTSMEVTDTDAFLDMGQGSQLLYFHLNQRADDDGFVANHKKIMRMIGSSDDDFKVLVAKKFLILFEDGVCVIKHWRINNSVRKDIYKPTKYLDLKSTLFIRSNGAYTLTDSGDAIRVPSGHYVLDDVNAALTLRQPRIEKDREGKDSKEEEENTSGKPERHISYLLNIPKEDIEEFKGKYNVYDDGIKGKAEELHNYCKAKGKVYKDYKAFLSNALKKDFGLKKVVAKPVVMVEITEEQRQANVKKLAEMKKTLFKKPL